MNTHDDLWLEDHSPTPTELKPPPLLTDPEVDERLAVARQVLTATFGLADFRPAQEPVIRSVLGGRDTLVIMPTGGGKSLCYQLPACISEGVTLVISPLIALMKDQVDAMQALGVPVALVNSTVPFPEVRQIMEDVRQGKIHLLYVAPERFHSGYFMQTLSGVPIARVAVDEAHCISQWGHDFRPAYLRLREVLQQLGRPPVVALTATATPQVQDDIAAQLGLIDPARFVAGFDRENLTLEVLERGRKKELLHQFMGEENGPGIIYCATRKHVDEVAGILRDKGVNAVPYHAGLPDDTRRGNQEDFLGGRTDVIVATNAFGMGVDKPDVRFVLHYDMPGTLEAYYQEAGRAGRDGQPSRCTVLYGGGDRYTQEFFINSAYPTRAFVSNLWRVLTEAADDQLVELSHQEMLARMTEEGSNLAVSSALKLLEECGGVQRLNSRSNPATIRLKDPKKLSARATVQQQVMGALSFHLPPGELGAVQIAPMTLADESDMDVDALLRALHAMHEAGVIEYIPPFRGRGIRLLSHELPALDFARIDEKRSHGLAALDSMEAYCRTPGCRRDAILGHFGEVAKGSCGACDRCRSGTAVSTVVEATELAKKLLSGVARCRIRGGMAFGLNTVAAHLAGANTESLRRHGLDKLSTYGLLKQYRQKEVVDLLEQLTHHKLLQREDVGGGGPRRPVVVLSEAGLALLKGGEGSVTLRLPDAPERRKRPALPPPTGANRAHTRDDGPDDPELFAELKALRLTLAEQIESPAYVVFSDKVLTSLVNDCPTTLEEMAQISGIGPAKLERYGQQFLDAINHYIQRPSQESQEAHA